MAADISFACSTGLRHLPEGHELTFQGNSGAAMAMWGEILLLFQHLGLTATELAPHGKNDMYEKGQKPVSGGRSSKDQKPASGGREQFQGSEVGLCRQSKQARQRDGSETWQVMRAHAREVSIAHRFGATAVGASSKSS